MVEIVRQEIRYSQSVYRLNRNAIVRNQKTMGFNRVFMLAAALLLVGACAKPNDKLDPCPRLAIKMVSPKLPRNLRSLRHGYA